VLLTTPDVETNCPRQDSALDLVVCGFRVDALAGGCGGPGPTAAAVVEVVSARAPGEEHELSSGPVRCVAHVVDLEPACAQSRVDLVPLTEAQRGVRRQQRLLGGEQVVRAEADQLLVAAVA
jgi:hypothetical protein